MGVCLTNKLQKNNISLEKIHKRRMPTTENMVKGFKFVLSDEYAQLSAEDKFGYLWFVRDSEEATDGRMYFGSRLYTPSITQEDFEILAERITNLDIKINAVDTKVDAEHARIDAANEMLDVVREKIDDVYDDNNTMHEDFKKMQDEVEVALGKVDEVTSGFTGLQEQLNAEIAERKAADEAEAERVDAMITELNGNVNDSIGVLNENMYNGFNTINGGIENEIKPAIAAVEEATKKNAADIATVNTNLVTAVDTINKNVADSINTINGGIDNEIRPALDELKSGKVDWMSKDDHRIVLENGKNLLGTSTEGNTYNIGMVSKWDIVDLGTTHLPLNLNSSTVPTVQLMGQTGAEAKHIAFQEDVESASTAAIEAETARALEAEANLQTNINDARNAMEAIQTGLQANINVNAEAIKAENARALEAEANLQAGINDARNAMQVIQDGLQANINANAEAVKAEEARALDAEANLQTAISDEASAREAADKALDEKVNQNAANINTVNSNLVTSIDTINKNLFDSINTINGGIDNEIRPELEKAVKYQDVATVENPGRKAIILENHDIILGKTTDGSANALIMMSKWNKVDVGTAQNEINLNGSALRPTYNDTKEIALLEDINGDLSTINLVQKSPLQYELQVGDRIAGTIDIPKDQFLKDISYDADAHVIKFTVETTSGDTTTEINISDLVDEYLAGNGLALDGHTFSVKLDGTSQKYIEVTAEGLKIVGIDEALAKEAARVDNMINIVNNNVATMVGDLNQNLVDSINTINGGINNEIRPELEKAVKYQDVATVENPGRKAIILENHDIILGKTTEGSANTLIMMSKWNKVDVGSPQNEINLNGSAEHPTYNDEKALAFVDDVTAEADARDEAINAVQGQVTAETAAREQAIQTLTNQVTAETAAREAAITGVQEQVASEATDREAADKDLAAQLAAETEARGIADTNLQNDLASEAAERSAADEAINEELAKTVKYQDVATEQNPGREAIVLANHDTILGYATDNQAYNLIMMSKWDKVDVGTAQKEINLNGSAEHPTYNDDKELAFVDDVTAEATARSEKDTELQANIQSEAEARIAADSANTEAINSEVARATEAEAAINEALATKAEKSEIPTVLPNPQALLLSYNGGEVFSYDGSEEKVGELVVNAANVPMSEEDETTIAAKFEEYATLDDIRLMPNEVRIPIRSLDDEVYDQATILEWFGTEDIPALKNKIAYGGIQYLYYGIPLSTNPHYYKMPIEYVAFESANQIKLVCTGLDTSNDHPTKYEIVMNLDGTIIEGNSNVKMTLSNLAMDADVQAINEKLASLENKTYIIDTTDTEEQKAINLEVAAKYANVTDATPVTDVFLKNNRVLGVVGASNLIPVTGARLKQGSVHFFVDTPVQYQIGENPANTNFGMIDISIAEDGTASAMTTNSLISTGGRILNYENGGLKAQVTMDAQDGVLRLKGIDDAVISRVNATDLIAAQITLIEKLQAQVTELESRIAALEGA